MKRSTLVSVLLGASVWATPVLAQTSALAPEDRPANVEDIIVTGLRDKAAENVGVGLLGQRAIIDTPFSVQSYSRDLLDLQQARSLKTVLNNDPSVLIETTAGSYAETITIRGFPVSNFYYDGFSGPASGFPDFPIDFVQSIDVLKGPSSLVFGGADPGGGVGGAVNYMPRRAPAQGSRTTFTAGVQNQGAAFLRGDLARRFGDDGRFGYRLAASHEQGELVAQNNKVRDTFVALSLDARVTDALTLILDAGHFEQKTTGYQDVLSIPAFALPPAPDAARNIANEWTEYRSERTFGVLKAEWRFAENWRLDAGLALTRRNQPFLGGALVVLVPPEAGQPYRGAATITPRDFEQPTNTQSANARLSGKFATGSIRHDLTLSARYDRNQSDGMGRALDVPGFGTTAPANIYNPIRLPRPVPTGAPRIFSDRTNSLTLQASDFVEITPWLTMLAGGGYVRLEDSIER